MTAVEDWLIEAKDDLKAAGNLGQAMLFAQACFHCQQAAEKALKALMISKLGRIEKTHSLIRLAKIVEIADQIKYELDLLEGDYTSCS